MFIHHCKGDLTGKVKGKKGRGERKERERRTNEVRSHERTADRTTTLAHAHHEESLLDDAGVGVRRVKLVDAEDGEVHVRVVRRAPIRLRHDVSLQLLELLGIVTIGTEDLHFILCFVSTPVKDCSSALEDVLSRTKPLSRRVVSACACDRRRNERARGRKREQVFPASFPFLRFYLWGKKKNAAAKTMGSAGKQLDRRTGSGTNLSDFCHPNANMGQSKNSVSLSFFIG